MYVTLGDGATMRVAGRHLHTASTFMYVTLGYVVSVIEPWVTALP
jgi:hypothetical protein